MAAGQATCLSCAGAVAAVIGSGSAATGAGDCWSPDMPLQYYDCCREVQGSGLPVMHEFCFDAEFTFERCCSFRFGPEVRGLPYAGMAPPYGLVRLDMGGDAGLISLDVSSRHRSHPVRPAERADVRDDDAATAARLVAPAAKKEQAALLPVSDVTSPSPPGLQKVWLASWYVGRALVDLPGLVSFSRRSSWPAFSVMLGPLLARSVPEGGHHGNDLSLKLENAANAVLPLMQPLPPPRLRVLDAGCGVGAAAVAAARAGHNVTAVDFDPEALAATRRNARRNGAMVATMWWDITQPPGPELLRRGPFDVAYAELGAIVWANVHNSPASDPAEFRMSLGLMIENLLLLDAHVYLFIGRFRRGSSEFEKSTAVLLKALHAAGVAAPDGGGAAARQRPCRCWPPRPGVVACNDLTAEAPLLQQWMTPRCPRVPLIGPPGWLAEAGLGPPTPFAFIVW